MDQPENELHASWLRGATERFLDALTLLSNRLNAGLVPWAEKRDLGNRGMWALRRIRDGDLYPKTIANAMMVAPSMVTSDLQRLVNAGLARGEPDPHDRRRTQFHITEAGRAVSDEGFRIYEKVITRKLMEYDRNELENFFRILDDLAEQQWVDKMADAGDVQTPEPHPLGLIAELERTLGELKKQLIKNETNNE